MQSLRSRLLILVLLATLLPAVPLSYAVRTLLDHSLNPATRDQSLLGLEAGLEESRQALHLRKETFLAAVSQAWRPQMTVIDPLVESGLVPLDADGHRDADAVVPDAVRTASPPVDGEPRRFDDWLVTARRAADGGTVLFAQPLPADMVARADEITGAISLLNSLRLDSGAVRRSFVLPFLVAYVLTFGVTLTIALWAARRTARPLEDLAAGARRVGEGDLDARVAAPTGGEIGDLAAAFNAMVERLARQRRDLARLEKMAAWRNMARVLAHEIKNPLTPILLAVQETRRSYSNDDAHARALSDCETIVTEEVEGLRDLVRSFSDFARMPQPEPADEPVGALIEDLGRLYGDRLNTTDVPVDLHWIFDAAQIRRALVNLIDNGLTACRRADRQESVQLEAALVDDALTWTVADRGDGIPAEHLDRVFEPDFTSGGGGMGLGLPIVAGIVEGHGGRIDISSGPEGTRFVLSLPRDPEKENLR